MRSAPAHDTPPSTLLSLVVLALLLAAWGDPNRASRGHTPGQPLSSGARCVSARARGFGDSEGRRVGRREGGREGGRAAPWGAPTTPHQPTNPQNTPAAGSSWQDVPIVGCVAHGVIGVDEQARGRTPTHASPPLPCPALLAPPSEQRARCSNQAGAAWLRRAPVAPVAPVACRRRRRCRPRNSLDGSSRAQQLPCVCVCVCVCVCGYAGGGCGD